MLRIASRSPRSRPQRPPAPRPAPAASRGVSGAGPPPPATAARTAPSTRGRAWIRRWIYDAFMGFGPSRPGGVIIEGGTAMASLPAAARAGQPARSPSRPARTLAPRRRHARPCPCSTRSARARAARPPRSAPCHCDERYGSGAHHEIPHHCDKFYGSGARHEAPARPRRARTLGPIAWHISTPPVAPAAAVL
jgi:hypothetical protein